MLSINEMLVIANQMHASDLHLSVGVPPKVRVFGDLVDIEGCSILTPADTAELGYSIIPPQLVQRFEEQGELDFSYAIMGEGRYRANVFHQRGSVAAVLRLIGMDIPSPSQLGIPNAVVDLTFKKRGLVLVTGPTGSGKSTTLASLINVINDRSPYHVITLEDPIEYLHPHKRCIVNQREIGLDTKSFSQALTSALREDPDVIHLFGAFLVDFLEERKNQFLDTFVEVLAVSGGVVKAALGEENVVDKILATRILRNLVANLEQLVEGFVKSILVSQATVPHRAESAFAQVSVGLFEVGT